MESVIMKIDLITVIWISTGAKLCLLPVPTEINFRIQCACAVSYFVLQISVLSFDDKIALFQTNML
jgi:hypothetical protein